MVRKTLFAGLFGLVFALTVLPALLVRGCSPSRLEWTGPPVAVYLTGEKKLIEIDLEEYVVGVVAAEMPAEFSLEALKAQAVAARTMTVKRMRLYGGSGCEEYPGADFSDQPDNGQAWYSDDRLRREWGWRYNQYKRRIVQAVNETRGIVLLYQGGLIEAVYHSTCGGRTENAADVWGHDVPYLKSVACSYDDFSPRYASEVRVGLSALEERLGIEPRDIPAGGGTLSLRILGRTEGGSVSEVSVGDKTLTGADFRQALALRSAKFSLETDGKELVVEVKGNGHGVGLCQYGAEGMARLGADYVQILRHYYTGITFGRLRGS